MAESWQKLRNSWSVRALNNSILQKHCIKVLGFKNEQHSSPLGNNAMTSHQITRLMNSHNLNLTSVHQCIIDGIDELHDEFLIIDVA